MRAALWAFAVVGLTLLGACSNATHRDERSSASDDAAASDDALDLKTKAKPKAASQGVCATGRAPYYLDKTPQPVLLPVGAGGASVTLGFNGTVGLTNVIGTDRSACPNDADGHPLPSRSVVAENLRIAYVACSRLHMFVPTRKAFQLGGTNTVAQLYDALVGRVRAASTKGPGDPALGDVVLRAQAFHLQSGGHPSVIIANDDGSRGNLSLLLADGEVVDNSRGAAKFIVDPGLAFGQQTNGYFRTLARSGNINQDAAVVCVPSPL